MNGFVDEPKETLRPVVDTPAAFQECLDSLSQGQGPVAFDAERAHGYRYWPKAYLFQARRAESGTWLIDPVALEPDFPDGLGSLVEAIGEEPWVIHAASQDLPCMRGAGIIPTQVFDTELAARLLGEPAVSLGALVESRLGIRLRKAHSAQNWATRPLPESWLNYAALDVDYLLELMQKLDSELQESRRAEWAEQEFAHTLTKFSAEPQPRPDPWRRLSGISSLRGPRQLALARQLWFERDRIAQRRDRPPSHILQDQAIVELAATVTANGPMPSDADVLGLAGFRRRSAKRYLANWRSAITATEQLSSSEYPKRRRPHNGIPHPRNWARTNPPAAALWPRARSDVDDLACDLMLQASLLAPTAILQQVVYEHAGDREFGAALRALEARPWQVEFLEPLLLEASQEA